MGTATFRESVTPHRMSRLTVVPFKRSTVRVERSAPRKDPSGGTCVGLFGGSAEIFLPMGDDSNQWPCNDYGDASPGAPLYLVQPSPDYDGQFHTNPRLEETVKTPG